MSEKQLQRDIITFLRGKGAYVLKNDATYRQGVPDLSFWHSDLFSLYLLEVKYLLKILCPGRESNSQGLTANRV